MGLSRLNAWISAPGNPCAINKDTWRVTILDCRLQVLEWCDKRYSGLAAKCGHLEVEVPPGCYIVFAQRGNSFSYPAMVDACCHEHVCVRLIVSKSGLPRPPVP